MEVKPDNYYPTVLQLCRLHGIYIAVCYSSSIESQIHRIPWHKSDIGLHIWNKLKNEGEYINAVYFCNNEGDNLSRLIKLAEHLHLYARDWIIEDVIPYKQCVSCRNICKTGVPMPKCNIAYIRENSKYCTTCLDF